MPQRSLGGASEVPEKFLGDLEGLETLSSASEAPGALRSASEVEALQRCLRGPSEVPWRCRRKALEVPGAPRGASEEPYRCLRCALAMLQRSDRSPRMCLRGALNVPERCL